MNKVICTICGTSYPENISECPICGFSHSSDHSRENSEHTYTHVPGGRFSKSNVRKRNNSTAKKPVKPVPEAKSAKAKNEKSNAGLVIVIILLLLAIITVSVYIVLRFFAPNFDVLDKLKNPSISQNDEEVSEEDTPVIPEDTQSEEDGTLEAEPVLCQDIILDQEQFSCDEVGTIYQITYQLEPADTEEEVEFSSSDEYVATVDAFGQVTVCGEGSAFITVTCGSASAQCEVICTLPVDESVDITLNRKEITFTAEGESWLLYDGPVDVEDILWTSDDNGIATIEDGVVVAVGNGDTTVYGFYDGKTVTCSIHCDFDDTADDDSDITEANGDSSTYKLYNLYGRADDVTINVGDTFPLKLIDENKNTVEGAEWSIENPKICSYVDGTVKGLAAGTTKIIATYNGHKYTCLVRVN